MFVYSTKTSTAFPAVKLIVAFSSVVPCLKKRENVSIRMNLTCIRIPTHRKIRRVSV